MRTSTLKYSKSPRRDILEKAVENISCVDFADAPVASSAYTTMVDGYPRPAVTVNELSQLSITGTPSRRPSVLRFSPSRNRSRGTSSGSDTQEPSTGEAAASPKTIFHATSWGTKRISVQVPEDAIDDENQDSPPPSPASDGPERRASLLRRCLFGLVSEEGYLSGHGRCRRTRVDL